MEFYNLKRAPVLRRLGNGNPISQDSLCKENEKERMKNRETDRQERWKVGMMEKRKERRKEVRVKFKRRNK